MSLRKRAYQAVLACNTGIPDEQVFSSGAVGQSIPGTSAVRPFIVIRFQPRAPGMLPRYPVSQQRWNVWVHDEPGTMEKIDLAVASLEKELPALIVGDAEGVRVMETVWENTFADGYDDHFGTNLTYVDFMTTYKTIPTGP
jgi:hypothetical protein